MSHNDRHPLTSPWVWAAMAILAPLGVWHVSLVAYPVITSTALVLAYIGGLSGAGKARIDVNIERSYTSPRGGHHR